MRVWEIDEDDDEMTTFSKICERDLMKMKMRSGFFWVIFLFYKRSDEDEDATLNAAERERGERLGGGGSGPFPPKMKKMEEWKWSMWHPKIPNFRFSVGASNELKLGRGRLKDLDVHAERHKTFKSFEKFVYDKLKLLDEIGEHRRVVFRHLLCLSKAGGSGLAIPLAMYLAEDSPKSLNHTGSPRLRLRCRQPALPRRNLNELAEMKKCERQRTKKYISLAWSAHANHSHQIWSACANSLKCQVF
ncbi:hypothetical protein LXL04_034692 [Taraxacum kok-saghyz]